MYNNTFTVIGTVVRKPVITQNSDGSSTALLTVAAKGGKNSKGEIHTDFISMRHYLKPGTKTYEYIDVGTPVAVEGKLSSVCTKDGNWVNNIDVKRLTLTESKVAKADRIARKKAALAAGATEEAVAVDETPAPEFTEA